MAELKQTPLGARIHVGPQPWQVIQRGPDGFAEVALAGEWVGAGPHTVEVRLAGEADNAPVPGCDWRRAEAVGEHGWRAVLRVPAGGPYRVESRLQQGTNEWRLTGDKIHHLFVGDIWVIAGQSNAVGYGHGSVYDPPQIGVSVFGGNEVWRLASHPIFDPTGTLHLANRDGGWVDVSPWLAFGRTIRQQTGIPVGLIPTALGGSPLSAWDPGAGEAVLYHNMTAFIRAAGGRVAGLLWYQGESDVGAELAATYLECFTRFIERFRTDFGADLPVVTAQLNRVFGAEASADAGWSQVREAQRQAARRIPKLAVVPTTDLPLSDVIHTSAAGNVLLGQRFATAALGLHYGVACAWQAVDLADARFLDAERRTIRLDFAPVEDHLISLTSEPQGFLVTDAAGPIPIAGARLAGDAAVELSLARAAGAEARCSYLSGADPMGTLRDHLQRPLLAFHGVAVR